MDKIPKDQLDELRDAFALFDKAGKGSITAAEVGDLARAMGTNCLVSDAAKLSGADKEPNKALKFEEFVPIMLDLQKIKDDHKKADYIEAFKCVLDNQNTGKVELDVIRNVLIKLGEKLPADAVDGVLKGMEDAEGNIKWMDVINKVLDGNY